MKNRVHIGQNSIALANQGFSKLTV